MNNIDETNISIFRTIQEKFNSFEKILFTIEDGSPCGIKRKDIKISFEDSKDSMDSMDLNDMCYQIVLYNTEIKDFIKNIYKNNIITIEINFTSCAMDLYQIDFFPKFIKNLFLQFKFNSEILKNLPEYLEYLHIYSNPREIKIELDNFPNKLKILEMTDIIYNLPLDKLPLSLEKLVLGFKKEYNHSFDNLPSSLNYLEITFYEYLDDKIQILNNLPEKLEFLKLKKSNGFEINRYPSNLKILELNSKNQLTNIPKNVKYMYSIMNVPIIFK